MSNIFLLLQTEDIQRLIADGKMNPEDAASASEELMMRNKDAVLAIFGPYIRQNCAKTDIYPLQKNKDRYRLRVPVKLRSQAGGALYIYGYTQKEVWRKAAEVFCDKKNSTVGAVYEAYHNETLADSHVAGDTSRHDQSIWNAYFDCKNRKLNSDTKQKEWDKIISESVPLYDITIQDIRRLKTTDLRKCVQQCIYGPNAKMAPIVSH